MCSRAYLFDIISSVYIDKTEVKILPQKKEKSTKKKNWLYLNVTLRVFYSIFLIGVALLLFGGALAGGIGLGYFTYLIEQTQLPSKQEIKKDLGDVSETSQLVYSDESLIATIQSDLRRVQLSPEEISPLIKKAVVATEDEYFYEHHGVVPKAVIRALVSEVTGMGSSGGSTLTQQLVKQQILTSETTFKRKATEMLLAMEVEKNFSKEEIITMYLNVSPFGRNNRGQNIAGVQEAAIGIFGVNASEVNLAQAAFIAGLPQSPITYSPYLNTGEIKDSEYLAYGLQRKDFVLFSMFRNHDITQEEYEEALAYDLTADFLPTAKADTNNQGYLYYAVMDQASEIVAKQLAKSNNLSDEDFLKEDIHQQYLDKAREKLAYGGYTVHTTIDSKIYEAMQATVTNYGYLLDNWAGAHIEVGNVLLENSTGKILGFVGGRDYNANQFNHAFSSKRQAGSAIKPVLVYGPAIDQGLIGTQTRVSDFPTSWGNGEDAGKPILNALNAGSKTFQTVRESIVRSDNIPANHIYQNTLSKMGSASSVYDQYLSKMNYPETPVWQYQSAPLGVAEISTLEQTNGFQALANNGTYLEGYLIESIIDSDGVVLYQHEANPVPVFSKAAASITVDLMRSVITDGFTTDFKSRVSNLNWQLGNADWVGKTGTTDENVDSWLVVSTPGITLGSWSGREDSKPSDASGGQRTANYMAQLVYAIYQANPDIIKTSDTFQLDPSVKSFNVSKFSGTKPGGTMTINNTTFTAPTETVTSYWAKNGPADISFKFGIGGTDANYNDYWKSVIPKPKVEEKKDDKKETEKKKDDVSDEKEKENNKEENKEETTEKKNE